MEVKKRKIAALVGTLLFILCVLLLLWLNGFSHIIPQDEEGVEVMIGNIDESAGTFHPAPLTPIDQPETSPTTPPQSVDNSTPSITQSEEESVSLKEQKKKKEAQAKAQLEEKRKLDAEKAKLAEEQRKINEINNKTSGAFGKGGQTGNGATVGSGSQGSVNGNSATGANTGVGGKGNSPSYSLKGRNSIGSLPFPSYNDQVEGTIVIDIVVSPEGKVIDAGIAISKTTIAIRSMRDAAKKAALQSRFTGIDSNENQIGTITYVYRFSR
ncbi:MAG: energy transducer TonB [Bacteroidales bacterium]|nr:energy transducer TonB [Bacteroidales bacterium]